MTLLTLFPPDLAALNEYFRTDVGDVDVRWPPSVAELLDAIEPPLYNLWNALLNRFVERRASAFDLVVGTDNELSVSDPLVQCIHMPRFARNVVSPRVGQVRVRRTPLRPTQLPSGRLRRRRDTRQYHRGQLELDGGRGAGRVRRSSSRRPPTGRHPRVRRRIRASRAGIALVPRFVDEALA